MRWRYGRPVTFDGLNDGAGVGTNFQKFGELYNQTAAGERDQSQGYQRKPYFRDGDVSATGAVKNTL